jgi:hypothetical protein
LTFVLRYNPSSRSYEGVGENPWASSWPIGPEKGWRPARMDELGKWIRGKFTKPMRSTDPVSSLRFVSNKAHWMGQRQSYSYAGKDLTAQTNPPRGVTVGVDDHSDEKWTFRFGAPFGSSLEVGEYGGAGEADPYDRHTPPYIGIEVSGPRRAIMGSGEFVVWEIEVKDQKVVRLAIDFICGDACGSLRVNSLFQPVMPVPGPDAAK